MAAEETETTLADPAGTDAVGVEKRRPAVADVARLCDIIDQNEPYARLRCSGLHLSPGRVPPHARWRARGRM